MRARRFSSSATFQLSATCTRSCRRSSSSYDNESNRSMTRPADYPPPFRSDACIAEPTDPVDERIEVGVLVIGAGPAGLACAIRFGQLLEEHPDVAERLGDVPLAVVEKGKQAGSHLLTGAVIRPGALERLFDGRGGLDDMPTYGAVDKEQVYVLTRDRGLPI